MKATNILVTFLARLHDVNLMRDPYLTWKAVGFEAVWLPHKEVLAVPAPQELFTQCMHQQQLQPKHNTNTNHMNFRPKAFQNSTLSKWTNLVSPQAELTPTLLFLPVTIAHQKPEPKMKEWKTWTQTESGVTYTSKWKATKCISQFQTKKARKIKTLNSAGDQYLLLHVPKGAVLSLLRELWLLILNRKFLPFALYKHHSWNWGLSSLVC